MPEVFQKITIRLVPFLVLLYLVAFLDRVNIGFAALSMNKDLGISDSTFGIAAGVFFVGYFLCEVPSNILMAKFGARAWISRIMVTWGLLSVCMVFVHGASSYIVMRLLLGAAEAGFFPGVILYLTLWLPVSKRAGIMSLFVFAIPLANVIGSPISAAIMRIGSVGGLKAWQWLFVLEGFPAVLLGCLVPIFLADGPWAVGWLNREEKTIVDRALLAEAPLPHSSRKASIASILTPFLCVASFTYFTLMIGLYGLGFWLPRILQSLGPTAVSIGWNSAIPYGIGGLVGVAWAYHSDSVQERRWHLLIAFATAALGQSIAAVFHTTGLSVCGFTLSAFGIFSGMPIFWSVVTNKLSGEMTAVGTALVNSLGNLGGFVGPSWIGWITAKTGNVRAGLIALAGLLLIAGFISIFVSGRTQPTPRRKLTGC